MRDRQTDQHYRTGNTETCKWHYKVVRGRYDYSVHDPGVPGYPHGKKIKFLLQGYRYGKKLDPYFTANIKINST